MIHSRGWKSAAGRAPITTLGQLPHKCPTAMGREPMLLVNRSFTSCSFYRLWRTCFFTKQMQLLHDEIVDKGVMVSFKTIFTVVFLRIPRNASQFLIIWSVIVFVMSTDVSLRARNCMPSRQYYPTTSS